MPQRFQQRQLASFLVGTPGLDPSAGAVEAQIAEVASETRALGQTSQIQSLRGLQSDINQARMQLFYANRERRALDKAEENLQRGLQVELDKVDENDRMRSTVAQIKQAYGNQPRQAPQAFEQQIPQMRMEFEQRYGEDDKRLKMLLPTLRSNENAALSELDTWSRNTVNQRLKAELNAIPKRMEDSILGLSGPMLEQLGDFRGILGDGLQIYRARIAQAVDKESADGIESGARDLIHNLTRQFLEKQIVETPLGVDGIPHLANIESMLRNPRQFGLRLSSDDALTLKSKVEKRLNDQETDARLEVKSEGRIAQIDALDMRHQLNQARSSRDGKAMSRIGMVVDQRVSQLRKEISAIEGEPTSKLKLDRLVAKKEEYAALLGIEEKEIGGQKELVAIAAASERLARQIANQAKADAKERRAETDRQIKRELAADKEKFNTRWTEVLKEREAAFTIRDSRTRTEALMEFSRKGSRVLDQAAEEGLITGKSYGGYLKDLKEPLLTGRITKYNEGFFGIGAGEEVLTGLPLAKAIDERRQTLGRVFAGSAVNNRDIETSIESMRRLTADPLDRPILEEFIRANMRTRLMDLPQYKSASFTEQAANRERWIKNIIRLNGTGRLR